MLRRGGGKWNVNAVSFAPLLVGWKGGGGGERTTLLFIKAVRNLLTIRTIKPARRRGEGIRSSVKLKLNLKSFSWNLNEVAERKEVPMASSRDTSAA
jgi:hypothetical protein